MLTLVEKSIHNNGQQGLLVHSAVSRLCQLGRDISHSDRAHICMLDTSVRLSI